MANNLPWITVVAFIFVRTGLGCPVMAEKGQTATLQCTFINNNATSVKWQLLNSASPITLSTCSFMNRSCSDISPTVYQGQTSGSGETSLKIMNVRIHEVLFTCLLDNGTKVNPCNLEVYVWPKKMDCKHNLTNTYLEIDCTTDVYQFLNYSIHRKELEMTTADFDPGNPECSLGQLGSGEDGDIKAGCIWRVMMNRMLLVNTFYVEMGAAVSDLSQVNKKPVVSGDIIAKFSIPQVVISEIDCPVGPGVGGKYILSGTNATCRCDLKSPGVPPGSARWQVNGNNTVSENHLDGSSTVTITDPNQEYQCWPDTPLRTELAGLSYTPKFAGCFASVEKGQPANLECTVPNNVTSVTWQLLGGSQPVPLTTCKFSESCSSPSQPNYAGSIVTSGDTRTTRLSITSARKNETQFACIADTGLKVDPCVLEVYASPKKPSCNQNISNDYADVTCTTSNVYPAANTVIYRREVSLLKNDTEQDYPKCSLGTGSDGDYSQSCTWRFSMTRMLTINNFYVEMTARISKESLVSKTLVTSEDVKISLSVPEVKVDQSNCPGIGGTSILKGNNATCKCDLKSRGVPPGFARWLNKYNETIGDENTVDGSSSITVKYNASDPTQSYQCWPITPLRANITTFIYLPRFTSSAPRLATLGLQALNIALVTVFAGVMFPFS